uniref:Uncharacterized protein n=1 Tax=Romanomermis culicivorax TaxID=13658 RepID=A0A915HYW9_ROMCU
MWQMKLLILLSLFCCASIANNIQRHALETTDGEKTKEAIRLWIFHKPMQLMLSEPRISESDLQNGKQLMDRVRICEPVFETGLIYNSTIGKTVKMMDKFRSEQLIDDNVYTVMRDTLGE